MKFFLEKAAKTISLAFSQLFSPPMYISTYENKDVGKVPSCTVHPLNQEWRKLLSGGRCLMATLPDTFTGILQQLLPVAWAKRKKSMANGLRMSSGFTFIIWRCLRLHFHINLESTVPTTGDPTPDILWQVAILLIQKLRLCVWSTLSLSTSSIIQPLHFLQWWPSFISCLLFGVVDNRVERTICKALF